MTDDDLQLARNAAISTRNLLTLYMPLEELMSIAVEAVMLARRLFDPERGPTFERFARIRVHHRVIDHLRHRDGVVRVPRRRYGAGERAALLELVPDTTGSEPDNLVSRLDASRFAPKLADAIDRLPERERSLVIRVYFGDHDIQSAGKTLGISKSWASRMHAKALGRLHRSLFGRPRGALESVTAHAIHG